MADFSRTMEQLQNFDFNDIDFNRVGVWPVPAKIFLCVIAISALIAGCYFLVVKDKQLIMQTEVAKEEKLKKDFQGKAHEAANLDKYREQMAQMSESFEALISRLPTDTEVPGLIEDIDDKGEESRLEIDNIDMLREVSSDFHVEKPFNIRVTGGYHEFGAFVSGVAGMPRIVTLHNFSIAPKSGSAGLLTMQILAKTYRYKDEGQ